VTGKYNFKLELPVIPSDRKSNITRNEKYLQCWIFITSNMMGEKKQGAVTVNSIIYQQFVMKKNTLRGTELL